MPTRRDDVEHLFYKLGFNHEDAMPGKEYTDDERNWASSAYLKGFEDRVIADLHLNLD